MAIGEVRSEQAELVIKVTDLAQRQLREIEKSLRDLRGETVKTTEVGKDMETGMSTMAKSLLATAGAALTIGAAVRGLRAAWEFAEAGIDDRRVNARFLAIAGSVDIAAERMAALRGASEGVLEDTELERASVLLDRIGIKGTQAQASVTAFARAFAKENNESLQDVQRQLAFALKTGEARSLARFGVVIDDKQVLKDYAASLGLVAEQLSKAQRASALKGAAAAEMGNRVQYATKEINGMEQAATAWANAVSDAQRAFADFVDPIAAARAKGAGNGFDLQGVLGMGPDSKAQLDETAKAIAAAIAQRNDLMEQATRSRSNIVPGGAGLEPGMISASQAIADGLDQQAAMIEGRLDTLKQALLTKRTEIQEAAAAIQIGLRDMTTKGVALGQDYSQSVAELDQGIASFQAMADLASKIGWKEIAADYQALAKGLLDTRAAFGQIAAQQEVVRGASIAELRLWQAELVKLTALGGSATEQDKAQAAQLKSMVAYFGELHAEGLKAVASLDKWVDTSAGALSQTQALTKAQAAWVDANKIATSGEGDLAAALVKVEQAMRDQQAALVAGGMAMADVNLVMEVQAQKLDYLRQGLDAYLSSLEKVPGVVAPTGLGLDPAELAKARAEANKAFTPTRGGGSAPEGASQELLTQARIARGEIQGEVAQILALNQAQLADLERTNLTAEALEARRVLIVKDGADQLAAIGQQRLADQDAANGAWLQGQQEAYRAELALARDLEDERVKQLTASGMDPAALLAQRELARQIQDGAITEELAAERQKTLAIEAEYEARKQAAESYRDGAVNAAYSLNDATWKLGQAQQMDESMQAMQKQSTMMATMGADFARASYDIAEGNRTQANSFRELATEEDRLAQMRQQDQSAEKIREQQQVIDGLSKAAKASQTQAGLGVAATISTLGGVLGIFAGGAREAAAIMAAFSAAAAIFAFATPGGQMQGVQYAAAAAMFAAMALTSPSKKKGSAPEIASQGLAAPTQRGGDIVVNVNMTEGVIYGDPGQIGENIIRAIKGAEFGSARIPKGVIA